MNALPNLDLSTLTALAPQQLHIPAKVFKGYGARDQTRTDRAREVAAVLGLRPATRTDLGDGYGRGDRLGFRKR